MGWDRPLQGFFMVIEFDGEDQLLYSNLDDPVLADSMGMSLTMDHFVEQLDRLGITVPQSMLIVTRRDAATNAGNRVMFHQ